MSRLFEVVKKSIINAYYWWLDYVYISFWQVVGVIRPAQLNVYVKRRPKDRPAIVLVPGIYETWQFMKPVADKLYADGYDIHIVEALRYNRAAVEEMAAAVRDYITANIEGDCIILAHSKGGLIGKYVLANYNQKQTVQGVIAINTPFTGSKYAYFTPFKSLRVFQPTSPLLTALAVNKEINKNIVSIYGVFDPHVPGGSYLEGAKNSQIHSRGHFRIINNHHLYGVVAEGITYLHRLRS